MHTSPSVLSHHLKKQHYQYGFTLLELIMTVMILAMLSALAIPSLTSTIRGWEANKVQRHIINGFRQAKAESLMHHQNIIFCPADNQNKCTKKGANYLLIFSDTNANNAFDAAIDTLLTRQSLHLKYGHIHLRAGQRDYIKFYGDTGLPRGHFGHIKYCPNNGLTTNMYQISINQHGNYRHKPFALTPTDCPSLKQ